MFDRDELFHEAPDEVVEAAYADLASSGTQPALDEMEPGPILAARLACIDVTTLSPARRLRVLKAQQRMASHFAAQMLHSIAAVSDSIDAIEDDPKLASESAAAEIRAALRLTRRAADGELTFALDLRRRLPAVWRLLAGGEIDRRRAWVIVKGTEHLTVAAARRVVDRLLEDMPRLTTGQLGARLRRACLEFEPADGRDRYRSALSRRRVVSEADVDGTAHLFGLDLPPHRVAAVKRKINRMAESLRRDGETRTMDQLRADVFLDLLAGRTTGAGGVVDIQVDLGTLAQLAEHPGDLAGYGPVVADIARQVAEEQSQGEWRFTVRDPDTGAVFTSGLTRRRPGAATGRRVQARDRRCLFPGCRMPATECDLDHMTPYGEGGETSDSNLAPLCRHDHRLRNVGWNYRRLENGDYEWTSRLGLTYLTSGRSP